MFGKDSSNNYGYIIPGADTVVPFKSTYTPTIVSSFYFARAGADYTITDDKYNYFICVAVESGLDRVYGITLSSTATYTQLSQVTSGSSGNQNTAMNIKYIGYVSNFKVNDKIHAYTYNSSGTCHCQIIAI